MEFSHRSVLLWECIEALNIRPDGVYLDGTAGGGGHSFAIASRITTGRLIALDRDPDAVKEAGQRLQGLPAAVVQANFTQMAQVLESLGVDGVDGVLLDIGVSSHQLDEAGHPEAPGEHRVLCKDGQHGVAEKYADGLHHIIHPQAPPLSGGRPP